MAKSGFKLIRGPRYTSSQEVAIIKQELANALRKVGAAHVAQRRIVVFGWQPAHRPKFGSEVMAQRGRDRVTLLVTLDNAAQSLGRYGGTIGDLWRWTNLGTRAHKIVPRFKSILRFVVGAVAVFTPLVNHPGTRAKKHDERINRRLKRFESNKIFEGFQNAFSKLNRR